MCGIVGLYLKNPALESQLGKLFEPMLEAMTGRGPDSAGFAIYGDEVQDGWVKLTLQSTDESFNWQGFAEKLQAKILEMREQLAKFRRLQLTEQTIVDYIDEKNYRKK